MPTEAPIIKTKSLSKIQKDSVWNVIIYDDPVNLMQYVTKVIMKVFGYSSEKAETMMMEVHNAGRSIVWSGGRERAELYVQQLQECQLTAGLSKN